MENTPDSATDDSPRIPATIPIPVGLATALGIAVLFAGAFVTIPVPLAAFAAALAALGALWIAVGLRRWQVGLAAVILAARFGAGLFTHRPPPPGGTGTLLTLISFAVLVLGGAWVGGRGEKEPPGR